jgi:hypothetical protein
VIRKETKIKNFLVIAAVVFACFGNAHADVDEIRLYIPAFEGPDSLGKNVATILNLQIWRTLRREPDRDPQGEDFGRGMIIWGVSPLKVASHVTAEQAATEDNIAAQFVLWGETFAYGDGVIGQAHLSIPIFSNYQREGMVLDDYRDNYYEIWRLPIKIQQQSVTLIVDIPNRRYEFSPIVLSKSIVEKYSLPSRLKMHREATVTSEVIGEVGEHYVGIEPRGHYQFVYSNGKRGWVYLPDLAKERNEVVDFIGGVIRVYRADWRGAIEMMNRVIENHQTPNALKVDALLYKGRSLVEIGENSEDIFSQAYQLNPYSRRTVQYWVMSRISKLSHYKKSGIQNQGYRNELNQTYSLLKENQYLFSKNDSWFNNVKIVLDYLSI